ncbi:MAG: lipoate--protein ligase family protein [Candidatus Woesearchaeota archaeon]
MDKWRLITNKKSNAYYNMAVEKGKKAPSGHSAACFDAPSWYEVVLDNKKLIGSAQLRNKGTILQHGSLPIDIDAEKIFNLLNYNSENERRKARMIFIAKSTSLKKESYNFSHFELEKALTLGLINSLGIEIEKGSLTKEERELAEKLAEEKYSEKNWIYKR